MPDDATWIVAWVGTPLASALAALLGGAVLGVFFFGGLWWTVQRVAASPRPVRWLLGSFALRTALVVPGVYFVTAGQPVPLGLCALGFVLARMIVLRSSRPRPAAAVAPSSRSSPCA